MGNYTAILYGKECNTEKQGKRVRLENLASYKICYLNSRLYIEVYLDRVIDYNDRKTANKQYIGAACRTKNSNIIEYRLL